MQGLTELGGVLHEEHFRIVVWLGELKNRAMADVGEESAIRDHDDEREMLALIAALSDFFRHHAFEEEALFPHLRSCADEETTAYLAAEHATIEPIVERVQTIAAERLRRCADRSNWSRFRRAVNELYTEVIDHLAREEEVIVRRLCDLLDADTDQRLARQHSAHRLLFSS